MDLDDEDFSLDKLGYFLKNEEYKLKSDKVSLERNNSLKFGHSTADGHDKFSLFHNFDRHGNILPHSNGVPTSNKVMLNDGINFEVLNSREKEKDKLINILSISKTTQSSPDKKAFNKLNSPTNSLNNCVVHSREKEKDRLAEIFASSGFQFNKTSNIQVSKNINDYFSFDTNQGFYLKKNKCKADCEEHRCVEGCDNCNALYLTERAKERSDSVIEKYKIPKILVSEYKENSKPFDNKVISAPRDSTMVRIGEFSPLNPNNPAGKAHMGLGEYEERRKFLIDQRRQEYNEYLQQVQQVSKCQTPTKKDNHNTRCKDAGTQTIWEDDVVNFDCEESAGHCSYVSPQQGERHCKLSPVAVSPVASCFEGLTEKEIKEHIYREELRKQIEEKNRLKEEMKRIEEEEEAKLEAKIKRDQEEMKKQFEAERLQRLELAIRKKEQEDILRQNLAAEQQKALQESKAKKKQLQKDKVSPREPSIQKHVKSTQFQQYTMPLSQSLPSNVTSKALSGNSELLKQPLFKVQRSKEMSSQTVDETEVPSRKGSALSMNENVRPSARSQIHKGNEIDMLVQSAVFDPNTQSRISQENSLYHSHKGLDYKEEVDRLMKEPLLESFRVLPPMSPPLLHATVPPINPSQSPPIPASRQFHRTNSDLLQDKWKVPYEDKYNGVHPDISTKHNRSVLTQLGAFRKHLQQERLKMQQRLVAESP